MLLVENLKTYFHTKRGTVKAVDGVSFEIGRNEKIGIVGESGAGKSVTGLSILQLIENPGRIESESVIKWKGDDLLQKDTSEMEEIRGNEISWIPQDPLSALNPTRTIGDQIKETMVAHDFATEPDLTEKAIKLLEDVGIPDPEKRLDDYPHEYSGGMRQRVLIAIALSCDPDLIIADEPTTALDVVIQSQIVELIDTMVDEYNTSLLLITHDLGLIAEIADKVMIMYAGQMVEKAGINQLFNDPLHPYTNELMKCSPSISSDEELHTISGTIPEGTNYPNGCRFHPRCPQEMDHCSKQDPQWINENKQHQVRCYLYE